MYEIRCIGQAQVDSNWLAMVTLKQVFGPTQVAYSKRAKKPPNFWLPDNIKSFWRVAKSLPRLKAGSFGNAWWEFQPIWGDLRLWRKQWLLRESFLLTQLNSLEFLVTFLKSAQTFPGIFINIPRNLFEDSLESSQTFPEILSKIPGIFLNITWNLFKHSSESSRAFLRIFWNIRWNVEMIAFLGTLKEIPWKPSEHSLRSLDSPHSVPRSSISDFINSHYENDK